MSTAIAKTTPVQQLSYGDSGIQLRTFEEAFRFAKAVANSGLAPKDFRTPDQILIALQHGAELGLRPMQSLHSIAVINNRPCLWGDALPAIVHASGRCESINESYEGDGDTLTAVCIAKRRDQTTPVRRTFSVADAKRAKLWGKAGPWSSYPKRMLQIRARAYALRDAFADALAGFSVAEEMMDVQTASVPPHHREAASSVVEPHESAPVTDDPVLDELGAAAVGGQVDVEAEADLGDGGDALWEPSDDEKAAIAAEEVG